MPGSAGEHALQVACHTTLRAGRFYRDQVIDRLNPAMIEFVGRMEMAFIATADARGECDASFRAGPPGFLHVLTPRLLAYPEYRGNGVMASLGNIAENQHIGMMMIDFVRDQIGLHVNGAARSYSDAEARVSWPSLPTDQVRGRLPERWVLVQVEEAYIHCRKHIPRMETVPRERSWGTDNEVRKGGDYFGVRADREE
jgi:predicted pyridoxine 5'-phosphate oxidase superfamily flavin-nucleotide-binding protein